MFNGIAKFIYKIFGFDVDIYNKHAARSDQYIFESKPKLYLFIKFGTFALIFLSAAVFIYMYCVVLYSPFVMYPYLDHHGVQQWDTGAEGMGDVEGRAWIYLVFAVIYSFSAIRLWNVLWSLRHKNKVQRSNILYSFNYIFFMTAGMIVIVRFSLYFTLDDIQNYLTPSVMHGTYLKNKGHEMNVTMITVGYFWLILVTILNFIFIALGFVTKPKLRKEVKERIESDKKKHITIIQDEIGDVRVYLPKFLLPNNEHDKSSLKLGDEVIMKGKVRKAKDGNGSMIQIIDFDVYKHGIIIAPDNTKKDNLIKPDENIHNEYKPGRWQDEAERL